MSAYRLREAAALIRRDEDIAEQLGHIDQREFNTWLAVADQLEAAAVLSEWEKHIGIGVVSDVVRRANDTADAYLNTT